MNKIEQLIKELCPNGVKKVKLGEVCEIKNGYTPSKKESSFWLNGTIPWVRLEDIRQNGRKLNDAIQHITQNAVRSGTLFKANSVIVSTTATIGEYALVSVPFLCNQQITCLSPNQSLNANYLYHYASIIGVWCKSNVNGNGLAIVELKKLRTFEIPLPPLPIQQSIVDVLDKFEAMRNNLNAELALRRKQYELYREKLLTFGDDVERVKLGDVCTLITDGSHNSPKTCNGGYYMPSVKDMRNDDFDFSDCKQIAEEDYKALEHIGCKPRKNDVLIAKDGSMLKYAFAVKTEREIVVLSSIAIIRPKTNVMFPQFLAHYFRQESFKKMVINDFSSKGGVPRIVLKNFKKIEVVAPTYKVQQTIVTKLDKFEALISNIEQELELRTKQYEYYREKLLTF